jgi:Asp-tRNA(Asn)/Glu-tRNA(Gln) amidotransferase A subunit family amidase
MRLMNQEQIENADLAELAAAVRSGRLTATRLVEHCLAAYNDSEPRVHAFAWVDPKRALAHARRVDERLAAGSELGLLAGVPIGVKDIFDTAGVPTEHGSEVFKGRVPERSAATVLAIEREDAVMFGKTVTAELAYFHPGPTRNPWNTARTPGGSSMGSAAAVAASMVPGSIGSQTNGSVIRPAAFCGVVGFKPSFGRLPTDGVLSFSPTLDHIGAFARTVEGVALLAAAMAGDPMERWLSSREWDGGRVGPRLAAVRTSDWSFAKPAITSRFEASVSKLAAAGARVESPDLPDGFDDAARVHRTIMAVEAVASLGPRVLPHRGLLSNVLVELFDEGSRISAAEYRVAVSDRRRLIQAFREWLAPYDALVTIPTSGEAPGLETTGDPRFCTRWTLLGAPAIALPTGAGPTGLPLGLQIVGAPSEDARLLSVARWAEGMLEGGGRAAPA